MWPFKKKPKPICKEVSREFLRQDTDVEDGFQRYWFATTYEDILSGDKKVKESWSFYAE